MTPIDKAIKALERLTDVVERSTGHSAQDAERGCEVCAALGDARQALSDLSSLKLEDGDVAWMADILNVEVRFHPSGSGPLDEYEIAQNARLDRLLSALGHGREG